MLQSASITIMPALLQLFIENLFHSKPARLSKGKPSIKTSLAIASLYVMLPPLKHMHWKMNDVMGLLQVKEI